jgi:L-seryl-tRNA(Ser) seleniumtransferase
MLGASEEALRERADRIALTLANAHVIESSAFIGGGSLPDTKLPSIAVAITTPHAADLAQRLRAWRTPIVGRIEDGFVILDMRTILPAQDRDVVAALSSLAS